MVSGNRHVYQVLSTNNLAEYEFDLETERSMKTPKRHKKDLEHFDMTEATEQLKRIWMTKERGIRKSSTLVVISQLKAIEKQARHPGEILGSGSIPWPALEIPLDASSSILHTLHGNFEQQKKDLREYRNQMKELAELRQSMDTKE